VAPPSVRTRATRALALAVAVVLPAACSSVAPGEAPAAGAREELARNVILLLGDGLGQPQREFLRMAIAGPNGQLAMDRLDVTGSVDTTPAASDEVTDSAAAATAFATGVRTTNGAVGVDVDGEPLTTALELARDAGKATGLVTTSQVTDASPAAFAAHVTDRDLQSEIAEQYLEDARVDVILGGGQDHWLPEGEQSGSEDEDDADADADADEDDADGRSHGDLIARATRLGYTHVSDAAGLAAADSEKLLGLFAGQEMFEKGDDGEGRYAPAVPLPDMTRAALGALDRREAGFFLLVEEEGIDEMAHHNNAAQMLEAGRALEGAVEAALQFQAANPDTLIVVAGDHETGGMEVTDTAPGAPPAGEDGPFRVTDSDRQLWVDWSTADHTGAPTPITAGGPGAEAFEGDIQNTGVFTGVMESMSLAN
jgi:alkaline phosphatase